MSVFRSQTKRFYSCILRPVCGAKNPFGLVLSSSLRPVPAFTVTPFLPVRSYAKKTSGKGGNSKKSGKGSNASQENSGEDVRFELAPFKDKMLDALQKMEHEMSQIRMGRAQIGLLDRVKVEKDGQSMLLSKIAQISVKDPKTLIVILPDESITPLADRAIRSANLGFNPTKLESTVLQVPVPKMDENMKKTVLKTLRQLAEHARNTVRKVRQDARNALKKLNSLGSDEKKRLENDIQVATDKVIADVDKAHDKRVKDLQ